MEEVFISRIMAVNEPKTIFILCAVFIFADVITGYLKALKNKKINSSISRDGYIKKIGWLVALLLGFLVDIIVGIKIFLIGSGIVCVATEGISVYENLGELGINLPFKNYFMKLNNKKEGEK